MDECLKWSSVLWCTLLVGVVCYSGPSLMCVVCNGVLSKLMKCVMWTV